MFCPSPITECEKVLRSLTNWSSCQLPGNCSLTESAGGPIEPRQRGICGAHWNCSLSHRRVYVLQSGGEQGIFRQACLALFPLQRLFVLRPSFCFSRACLQPRRLNTTTIHFTKR